GVGLGDGQDAPGADLLDDHRTPCRPVPVDGLLDDLLRPEVDVAVDGGVEGVARLGRGDLAQPGGDGLSVQPDLDDAAAGHAAQLLLEGELEAGQALAVAPDVAQDVPGGVAVGVDPLGRGLGLDARDPEREDLPPLLRCEAAGDVDEGGVADELGAGLAGVAGARGGRRGGGGHRAALLLPVDLGDEVAHLELVDADVVALDGGGEHLAVGVEDVAAGGLEGGVPQPGVQRVLRQPRPLERLDVDEPAGEDDDDGEDDGEDGVVAPAQGAAHSSSLPPRILPSWRRMKSTRSAGSMPSSSARRRSAAGLPASSTCWTREVSASRSRLRVRWCSWVA